MSPRPEQKVTFRNYQPRDGDLKEQQLETTIELVETEDKDAAKEEKAAELEAAEVRFRVWFWVVVGEVG